MDETALPPWLDAMFPPGHTRRLLDVGGARMHVWEWGQGLPVVLVHGNPSWSFLWRKVVAMLLSQGQRIRVIVPDLIGLGLSDKPHDPAAHTLAAHRAWLGALIDQVAPTELVMAVQDWGGPIGVGALTGRADRLRGLVVLNTVLGPPRPDSRPTLFHRFAATRAADLAFRLGFPQNAMALSQGDKLSIVGAVARAYRWPLRHLGDRVAPLAMARMVPATLDHPSVAGLREVEALVRAFRGPTAIVWGERDPILGRALRRTIELLPRAIVTRTRAGHFLQEEVPEPIALAIADVVARVSAN